MRIRSLVAIIGLTLNIIASRSHAEGPVPFNSVVRPILAKHCLKCHGPDDKTRKANLRLDVRENATQPAKSGMTAIVPGKPLDSELIERIESDDEALIMPPPSAKTPLTQDEKTILKQWLADGADYQPHWAFLAPKQSEPPVVQKTGWPCNAIDSFVLARLEGQGLQASPQADRSTLIRRASLDLIGLPPTIEEVDAFVSDPSGDAYEKLIDRLLASPQYGERWARKWLDLARYSDTNGYEKDRQRSIWPYRDWVIQSINADMPFDQFTIEQLAGDMLPNATTNQKIATGFHRNTMLNEEGGIDPLEFRFNAMTDRVATTATVWLGLTLGCAQCHTHKYDPIPHKDYYQFMAFLNNADEPEMPIFSEQVAATRREQLAEIDRKLADLPNKFPFDPKAAPDDTRSEVSRRKEYLDRRFQEWLDKAKTSLVDWIPLDPIELRSTLPKLSIESGGVIFVTGDMNKSDTYNIKLSAPASLLSAIRLEVLPDVRLPGGGPGRVYYEGPQGDFFLSEIHFTADGKPIPIKTVSQTFGNAAPTMDADQQTGWSISGAQGQANSAIFTLAEPRKVVDSLAVEMLFERYYAAGLGKFRLWGSDSPIAGGFRQRPTDVENALRLKPEQRSVEQERALLRQFLTEAPELAKEREAIKLIAAYPTTLIMEERPEEIHRPTFIHNRGEYLQPTDKVDAGGLTVLPAIPDSLPHNRLGLARWLASSGNPLVGRVTMNRHWAAFFGQGLVRTPQDFGYQGDPPTHPELLDWLAIEFQNRGWSLKTMHKLIVMSATYQQSSKVTPELLAVDPENRLLARGPRVRLDAETIRDLALRTSGLLSTKIGGPSVFPPQPVGVSTEGSYGGFEWKTSLGEDRFRRSLYTFAKRTNPFAMLTTFDAPSGEVCIARREVSNTPLQALTLMNDPVFIDASQALGRLLSSDGGSIDDRIDSLYRRCLARKPTPHESELIVAFLETQLGRLERDELDAVKIGGPGEGDPKVRAAWTLVARAILNLDETITKE